MKNFVFFIFIAFPLMAQAKQVTCIAVNALPGQNSQIEDLTLDAEISAIPAGLTNVSVVLGKNTSILSKTFVKISRTNYSTYERSFVLGSVNLSENYDLYLVLPTVYLRNGSYTGRISAWSNHSVVSEVSVTCSTAD